MIDQPQNQEPVTKEQKKLPYRSYYPENKKILDAARLIIEVRKKEYYDSLDELCECLRQYDKGEDAIQLLKTIENLLNPAHSSSSVSVNDILKGVWFLNRCLEGDEGAKGYYGIDEVIDIKETLTYYFNSGDYYLADNKFRRMSVITDTDFIDSRFYDGDEYQIIYGTLYNAEDCQEIYNFIATMCNTAKAPILRKAWIDTLIKAVKTVIDNLEKCKALNKGEELRVFIPFLDWYEQTLFVTVRAFDFALNVLKQIRECDVEEIPLEESRLKSYPLRRMRDYMEDWADNEEEEPELQCIIHDEIARRGYSSDRVESPTNEYRTKVIGIQRVGRKEELANVKEEKPEVVSTIRRVGVLYCMLSQYNVDLAGMNKICSYVCADSKPFKGAKPENTIYTYLAHPEDRLFDKQDKIDYIKEKLDKYGVSTKGIPGLK